MADMRPFCFDVDHWEKEYCSSSILCLGVLAEDRRLFVPNLQASDREELPELYLISFWQDLNKNKMPRDLDFEGTLGRTEPGFSYISRNQDHRKN